MRSRLALVAVVLVVAAPIPGARAASGIDRYVATTGVDAGDCSDEAAPCATILYGVGQLAAGDTLRIASGTYVEAVVPGYPYYPPGASIVGAGPGRTILNGPGSCAGEDYSTSQTLWVAFDALRSLSVGCAGAAVQASDTVTIEDVEFLATAEMGIDTGYGPLTVRGSSFHGRTGVGNRGGDMTLLGNTFATSGTAIFAGAVRDDLPGPTTLAHANRLPAEGSGVELYVPQAGYRSATVDVADNWRGCNGGPGTAGCSTFEQCTSAGCTPVTAADHPPGARPVSSRLQLVPINPPATLAPGAQVELRFGLVGSGTKAIAAEFPPTAIALSADTATLGATSATTAAGVVVVTYTAPSEPGIYTVTAGLDAATAQVALNAPVAVAPTSPSPAPDVAAITPPPTATSEVVSTATSSPLPVVLLLGASVIAFLTVLEPRRRRR